ncbi:hypothetical protein EC518_03105 [Helicobacter pylori]|uniref:Uncharacterized protein n=1 Tax=Helicobacter pylori TaxID=210 RepID=A0A438XSD4_HELPX|nr:hypothetical protein EC518_03105 [Helicobacter pylori]
MISIKTKNFRNIFLFSLETLLFFKRSCLTTAKIKPFYYQRSMKTEPIFLAFQKLLYPFDALCFA